MLFRSRSGTAIGFVNSMVTGAGAVPLRAVGWFSLASAKHTICDTAGAIIYARRRPDPLPQVFGYHELFHVLTLAATACQYVAVAFYVLPRT